MTDLRVALLLYRPSASGISTYTVEVAKALSLRIREVYLCSLGMNVYTARELESKGVNIFEIGASDRVYSDVLGGPFLHYMLVSKRIQRALHEIGIIKRADILHFTLTPAALMFKGYVANAWVPLSMTEEPKKNLLSFKFPINMLANFIAAQYHTINSLVYRKASRIIAPARWVHSRLANKYRRVVYIPPPINPVNHLVNHNRDIATLLFVARDLELPRKNVNGLLNAVRILAHKGLKFRVLLIGAFSTRFHRFVGVLANKTGVDIRLEGYVPREKMRMFYAISDVIVVPSFYEELGYVALEGMAHGLPLIASNIPTFRNFVHDGINGFLVDAFDNAALASKLELLITDDELRKRMSRKSLEIIKENSSPKVVADKLVKLYEEMING